MRLHRRIPSISEQHISLQLLCPNNRSNYYIHSNAIDITIMMGTMSIYPEKYQRVHGSGLISAIGLSVTAISNNINLGSSIMARNTRLSE